MLAVSHPHSFARSSNHCRATSNSGITLECDIADDDRINRTHSSNALDQVALEARPIGSIPVVIGIEALRALKWMSEDVGVSAFIFRNSAGC